MSTTVDKGTRTSQRTVRRVDGAIDARVVCSSAGTETLGDASPGRRGRWAKCTWRPVGNKPNWCPVPPVLRRRRRQRRLAARALLRLLAPKISRPPRIPCRKPYLARCPRPILPPRPPPPPRGPPPRRPTASPSPSRASAEKTGTADDGGTGNGTGTSRRRSPTSNRPCRAAHPRPAPPLPGGTSPRVRRPTCRPRGAGGGPSRAARRFERSISFPEKIASNFACRLPSASRRSTK